MYIAKAKSYISTQVILLYLVMLPQFIAKYVFGMEEFLYINDKNSMIKDVASASDLSFETSTKPRFVEFYSPYCGHCIHFKKKYVEVAKEAYERYTKDEIEFYAISCAGVEELCMKYSIQFYPSLYAVPAGKSMFHNRTLLGNSAFSIKDVENIVQKSIEDKLIDIKQRRGVKEDHDEGQTQTDDDKSARDVKSENDGDDEKKQDGGDDEKKQDGDDDEKKQDGDDNETRNDVTAADKDGDDGENRNNNDNENERNDGGNEDGDDESDNATASLDKEFEKFKRNGRSAESVPMIASTETAGAARAKLFPKSMDKWKEILKQRLDEAKYKRLKRKNAKAENVNRDNLQHTAVDAEGATGIMLANRKGTKEYSQRQINLQKTIEKLRSYGRRKQVENPHEIANQLAEGQLPFKKRVSPVKIVERVPIIKHSVRMSHEEELILDASLSFLIGLRVGVYKSDDPLPRKHKKALKGWLDLLHVSLPPEWALQEVIGELMNNFEEISKSRKALRDILDQHMLQRHKWSKSCSRSNGFSCGFWKLLHTMTVGIAEYRGGQDLIASGSVMPASRTFSPLDAADTIREYMAHFFPCTECSKHFVGQYDQCELNRRCSRLTSIASTTSDADWKELAKWLWEVHNDVSIRLVNEKHEAKRWRRQISAPESDQIKAIWPAITDCFNCVNEDGSFNENMIFMHLEQTYWPGWDLKDTPRRLILFEDDGEGAIGLNLTILLIGLLIVALCQKSISRASFAQTILRAKTIGTRVVDGGKVRTI